MENRGRYSAKRTKRRLWRQLETFRIAFLTLDSQTKMLDEDIRASEKARTEVHGILSEISKQTENQVRRAEARKATLAREIAQQKEKISRVDRNNKRRTVQVEYVAPQSPEREN